MRLVRALLMAAALIAGCALTPLAAQGQLLSAPDAPSYSSTPRPQPRTQPRPLEARSADARPLAKLVRNPSPEAGAPPFALADDKGVIQRLVEPTPGVALEPHLGQIIRVNHDTGGTLLATQLDLAAVPAPSAVADASDAKTPPAPFRPFRLAQATSEALPDPSAPEPIVLEEIVGEPNGPIMDGLAYPPSISAGPSVGHGSSVMAPPAVTAPCVGCGSVIAGSCPHCSLHAGVGLPSIGGLLSDLDFSVDALLLRAHDSAGLTGGSDYEWGSRFELGVNGPQRHRLALRYMEYDTPVAFGSLDLETLDLEFQRRFGLGGRAEWGVGGGLRWAEYDERLGVGGAGGLMAGASYSETIGPLIGLYARTPAFGRVDGTFHLRQSWQFGDSTIGGVPASQGNFAITEVQFGLERRRQTRFGQTMLRGFLEAQNWSGVADAPLSSDRGLIGLGFGAGLRR